MCLASQFPWKIFENFHAFGCLSVVFLLVNKSSVEMHYQHNLPLKQFGIVSVIGTRIEVNKYSVKINHFTFLDLLMDDISVGSQCKLPEQFWPRLNYFTYPDM